MPTVGQFPVLLRRIGVAQAMESRASLSPHCRTGTVPERWGADLLPQAPRYSISDSFAHRDAEEGIGHDSFGFFCHLAPGRQDLGPALNRCNGILAQKEGAKSPFCACELKQQTFAPSNKCLYSFL